MESKLEQQVQAEGESLRGWGQQVSRPEAGKTPERSLAARSPQHDCAFHPEDEKPVSWQGQWLREEKWGVVL